ncbi:MAG: hypothetical protein KatS3mg077_1148 [Candidatus Binatia bacterium]|nr:MAG: hypothetical protein KatS3mg077_1148 [Candidatus Binatia bacterium]
MRRQHREVEPTPSLFFQRYQPACHPLGIAGEGDRFTLTHAAGELVVGDLVLELLQPIANLFYRRTLHTAGNIQQQVDRQVTLAARYLDAGPPGDVAFDRQGFSPRVTTNNAAARGQPRFATVLLDHPPATHPLAR